MTKQRPTRPTRTRVTGAALLLVLSRAVTAVDGWHSPFTGRSFRRPRRVTTAWVPPLATRSDVSESTSPETLRSITFCNLPKDQEPNLLCDFLLEVGACATWIVDADRGTSWEEAIFSEPVLHEAIFSPSQLQWAAPLWNQCNVTAMFPASVSIPATLQLVREVLTEYSLYVDIVDALAIETVPNIDWVVTVQKNWKPIVKAHNTFVFFFPWHTHGDIEAAKEAALAVQPNDKRTASSRLFIPIQLQGGIAFGTGEHATTELCLEWLATTVTHALTDAPPNNVSVLDYGSGSGILGLAACALDSTRVTAVGIDIDVDACAIANYNSVVNDLPMQSYLPPLWTETDATTDSVSQSVLLKAHHASNRHGTDAVSTWNDPVAGSVNAVPFTVVVANIMAGPLIQLASTLYTMIQPGGSIGMSGILQHQGDQVVQAYQAAGYVNVQVAQSLDGWVLVTAQRPDTDAHI